MSRRPSRQADLVQRYLLPVLGAVAIVFAGRAAWLFRGAGDGVESASHPSHRVAYAADQPQPQAATQSPTKQRRLTEQEFAAIAGLCPTAIKELPEELVPLGMLRKRPPEEQASERIAPPHQLTKSKERQTPIGRLTGIRVASKPLTESATVAATTDEPIPEGWLVAPQDWFVPEDPKPEGQKPVAIDRPSDDSQIFDDQLQVEAGSDSPPADSEPLAPQLESEPRQRPGEKPAPESVQQQPLSDDPQGGFPDPIPEVPTTSKPDSYPSAEQELVPEPVQQGPSFAPPGVATPGSEEESLAEGLSRKSELEELNDAPESSAVEAAAPEAVEPLAPTTPAWEGPFDQVVPAPAKEPPAAAGVEQSPALPTEEPARTLSEWPAREPASVGPADSVPEESESEEDPVEADPQPIQPATPPESIPAPPAKAQSTTADPAEREQPIQKPEVQGSLFAPPRTPTQSATSFSQPSPAHEHQSLHPGAGPAAAAAAREAAGGKSADESHRELFAKNNYPSAQDCAQCHQRIYDEWRVSSHAYAFVSPMYHKFEQTITTLSQGTVGHFCQRCHSPVATAMYEPRSTPIGEMAQVAREGVTCIACHRVNQRWGKSNGDRRIEPGDAYAPVYGGVGGSGVAQAIAEKDKYKVKTSPHQKGPGQAIHNEGRFFDQLTKAEACTSCHQVAVHPGVKLEVVWEQYRASPACRKGVTCQDCHMGRVPGVASGYNYGPVAELNGKVVNTHRKQSSHIFYGPGYSIAHPGIFPHNKDAQDWTVDQWLTFDWRAGWGTDEFEEKLEELEDSGVNTEAWFPKTWAEADDRYDAREIIDDNLEHLAKKRRYRELVMENGSKVDGPFFAQTPVAGRDLKFEYVVANLNEGHNLPTASLGAQPQLWANVVLIDPMGRRVWESGYTDSNGDLCDIHSVDVRKGKLPFDKQLFNLQTMFLITGATGTDREFYLPVNLDIDQVAHLRPGTFPITTLNHPPFIRMEMRSLSPLGKKRVKYTVPAELMRERGRYRLSFRLRNRTEPMYFMRLCESTPEMMRAMTEGTLDIHPQSVEFEVH